MKSQMVKEVEKLDDLNAGSLIECYAATKKLT